MKFYPLFLLPFLVAGCPFNKCGNGTTDAREECDDGNELNADGCEADCSLPACDNGIVDPGEVCFGEPVAFGTDTVPADVIAVDLDGDALLDLATANAAGNSLSVLLNDGDGGFTRQADIEFGQIALFVAAGDFDGDEVQELIASLTDADEIEVLRGLGDGSFEPLTTLTAQGPNSVLTGDFNKDGDLDIAVSSTDGVVLFLGDGAGGFEAPRISFVGNAAGLVKADFDTDGNLDVAAGVGGALVVLLGDGLGNFAQQAPQLAGEIQGDISVGDFDGNNAIDVAAAKFINNEANILTQDAGLFSKTQTLSVTGATSLLAGDVNQDGTPDIAVASVVEQGGTNLAIIPNEAGVFGTPLLFPVDFGNAAGLALADLNDDGATDTILTDTDGNQLVVFFSAP